MLQGPVGQLPPHQQRLQAAGQGSGYPLWVSMWWTPLRPLLCLVGGQCVVPIQRRYSQAANRSAWLHVSHAARWDKLLRQTMTRAVLYIDVITPRAAPLCISAPALSLRMAKVTFARDLLVAAKFRTPRNITRPAQSSPAGFTELAASDQSSRGTMSASEAELYSDHLDNSFRQNRLLALAYSTPAQ